MLTNSSVVKLRDDVRYRLLGGEAVAVQQSHAEVVVLNDVGARVVELVDGETTVRDLISRLASEYDVDPEQLAKDVVDYLEELVAANILSQPSAAECEQQ
jgi:coenzyme PQQ biosynthesis protein PqqD